LLPNVIIAGTNKSGTTSLFRYLADHPEVCPSRIKEVRFFSHFENPSYQEAQDFYNHQFGEYAGQQVRLEASPDYLLYGKAAAEPLARILPNAKLIFILREPLSRLISSFYRRKTRDHPSLADIDIYSYLDSVFSGSETKVQQLTIDLRWIDYAERLSEFLDCFPADNIAVRFFDHLGDDSSAFVMDLCGFLEIDPDYYLSYTFQVENRTRNVKSSSAHRVAYNTNLRLEPFFNRYPAARRITRRLYSALNYTNVSPIAQIDIDMYNAHELYVDQTKSLKLLLKSTFPDIDIPSWMN